MGKTREKIVNRCCNKAWARDLSCRVADNVAVIRMMWRRHLRTTNVIHRQAAVLHAVTDVPLHSQNIIQAYNVFYSRFKTVIESRPEPSQTLRADDNRPAKAGAIFLFDFCIISTIQGRTYMDSKLKWHFDWQKGSNDPGFSDGIW